MYDEKVKDVSWTGLGTGVAHAIPRPAHPWWLDGNTESEWWNAYDQLGNRTERNISNVGEDSYSQKMELDETDAEFQGEVEWWGWEAVQNPFMR